MKVSKLKLVSLATALSISASVLLTTGNAHAMSTQTAPQNWRFTSGSTFNGVNFDGVARITFDSDGNLNNGAKICSGTLLQGGQYVMTAAHCADNFNVMKVEFGVNNNVARATRGVSSAFVNSNWAGSIWKGADIAILKLDQIVADITGFNLHTSSAMGMNVLQMGYGTTNTGSSNVASGWSDWGWGHWGMNTYDVSEEDWNFETPGSNYGVEYVADFDNGTSQYNTLANEAAHFGGSWTSGTGIEYESLISGGDSGGGDFIWTGSEWLLTGVHSWGAWWCNEWDASCANRSSYGDLSGASAVYSHYNWIDSIINTNRVPEPGTLPLLMAGLFAALRLGQRRKSLR